MGNKITIITEGVDKASGVLGNIAKSVAGIGIAAGAAAIGGIAALGLGMIKLAKDAEPIAGVRSAFNALAADFEGGSAAMLAAMSDSSRGFITNTDLMTSFNKAAGLVSTEFAETLPNAFEYLGKVSAATGQDMGFLLDSLVTGVGRLSPMILDNLQIQVDLNQAYDDYAAKMGLVASDLTKAEQQAALTDQAMGLLAANTADMAAPTGGFAQLGVMLANFRDEIGVRLLPVFTPLLEAFQRWASDAMPKVLEFLDKITPGLTLLSEALVLILEGDGKGGIRLVEEAMFSMGMAFGLTYEDAVDFAFGVGAKLKWLKDVAVPWLREKIGGAVIWLGEQWRKFLPWIKKWLPIALKVLGMVIKDIIMPALKGLWQFIKDNIKWVGIAFAVFTLLTSPILLLGVALVALGLLWAEHGAAIKVTLAQLKFIIFYYLDLAAGKIDEFFGKLGAGWELIKGDIENLKTWFSGVSQAVWDFAAALGIVGISIPYWLTPGSPTPLEMGLRGITSAMAELNSAATIPMFGGGYGGAGRSAAGNTSTTNFNLVLQTGEDRGTVEAGFGAMQQRLAGGI